MPPAHTSEMLVRFRAVYGDRKKAFSFSVIFVINFHFDDIQKKKGVGRTKPRRRKRRRALLSINLSLLICQNDDRTHIINGFFVTAGLREKRVTAHIIFGTGSPMQWGFAGYIALVYPIGPGGDQILQNGGVAKASRLVDEI